MGHVKNALKKTYDANPCAISAECLRRSIFLKNQLLRG